MAISETLLFTGVSGSAPVVMEHRPAALGGSELGIVWNSFAPRAEGQWPIVKLPGMRGGLAKDFRPGPITWTIRGTIHGGKNNDSVSLITRYTNLEIFRNEVLEMFAGRYNIAVGPFTMTTAPGGSVIIASVVFDDFTGGPRQRFSLEAVHLLGRTS